MEKMTDEGISVCMCVYVCVCVCVDVAESTMFGRRAGHSTRQRPR